MKRDYPLRKKCAHIDCNEYATWRFDRLRDLQGSYELKHEYRCVRHTRPEELLSLTNAMRETELVVCQLDNGNRRFGSIGGFVHGNGYKAFADDFPVGTKLIITARIEVPK